MPLVKAIVKLGRGRHNFCAGGGDCFELEIVGYNSLLGVTAP